jgi:hypothetical protein
MLCCIAISYDYRLNCLGNWQVMETVRDVKSLHSELFFCCCPKETYVLKTPTLTAVVDVGFESRVCL